MRHSTLMILPLAAGCALLATLLQPLARADAPETDRLIEQLEQHYNRAKTLSIDFTESYRIGGRERRPETGTLVLKKPGRMRWTYTQPAGKLFVSDGKSVFLYTAADNRVERSTLKASEDLRAPLAFLLGRLDLKREFNQFQMETAGDDRILVASARNDRLPYSNVRLRIADNFAIRELTVTGRDTSTLGFSFTNEVVNLAVPESAFHFTPPAGAEVVDAVAAESGDN